MPKVPATHGNDNSSIEYNEKIAESQRSKTVFRAHRTALNADKYNPARLDNAIQQTLSDPA